MSKTRLLEPQQVRRTVRRLAFEILERNQGATNLVILGIERKGAAVGRSIAEVIEQVERVPVICTGLDVSRFRDDRGEEEEGAADQDIPDLTDRDVILADDVLFTGRTTRAALDAVIRFGRPRSIQLAVLVDRGHREYPIQPDYVGRRMPTKHRERVIVSMGEEPSVEVLE